MTKLFLPLFLLALLHHAPPAKTLEQIRVETRITPEQTMLGDTFSVKVTVILQDSAGVILRDLPPSNQNIVFEKSDSSSLFLAEDGWKADWTFKGVSWELGEHYLPPQKVLAIRHGDTLSAKSDPLDFWTIRATVDSTMAEMADPLPVGFPRWIPVLGWILLLLGLILFFIFRKRKPKKESTTQPSAQPEIPPDEHALHRLAELKGNGMLSPERSRESCFVLSEILREYVSNRYDVDALESTTSEFLQKAESLPATEQNKAWLKDFCELTDPVKFASVPMDQAQIERAWEIVERFVKETKPINKQA